MASYESSRRCMLCLGWVDQLKWTKEFTSVLLEGEYIKRGFIQYSDKSYNQQSRSQKGSDEYTVIRVNPSSSFTPVKAFLVHVSCECLLRRLSKKEIRPDQLFKLCQSLQPDRQRNFEIDAEADLSGCLDPSLPLISPDYLSRTDGITLNLGPIDHSSPALLRLPTEVILMILECLPPSHVIKFLLASKKVILYADEFCKRHPYYFYHCSDTVSNFSDKRKLIIALAMKFSISNYHVLDMRWQIVSKIAHIATLIPFIKQGGTPEKTLDPRAPLQFLNHHFGLHEAILQVPDDVKVVDVSSIILNSRYYVCGIGFRGETTYSFFGNKTRLVHTSSLDTTVNTIRFAVDALGIRSLKWGICPGIPEDLGSSDWWEGFSRRQDTRKIKVICDDLKLRHVSWYLDRPCSFTETLLMRGGHVSAPSYRHISQKHYIQQHPSREADLIARFGNFTTESLLFDRDLQSITIYFSEGLTGIIGISIQRSSRSYSVGTRGNQSKTLTLRAPDEVLTEVNVLTSTIEPLDIALKTSYGRQLQFSQSGTYAIMSSLQPPAGHYIGGLFFRFGGIYIESLGMICAASSN
ncbi:hypothetical protein BDV06DRAFT_116155 [Aspergillus oleicola]